MGSSPLCKMNATAAERPPKASRRLALGVVAAVAPMAAPSPKPCSPTAMATRTGIAKPKPLACAALGERGSVERDQEEEADREAQPERQVPDAAREPLADTEQRSVADRVREEPEVEADGEGREIHRPQVASRSRDYQEGDERREEEGAQDGAEGLSETYHPWGNRSFAD